MTPRKLFFSLLLLCGFNSIFCQTSGKFYEVDSITNRVRLFFNSNYILVPKKCANFVRLTKIDSNANFNSDFVDSTFDNKILGKGHYSNGIKDGYFEFYYPNEVLQCKGYYSENEPVGQWLFYYPDGKQERILSFTETDTLLTDYNDPSGNPVVVKGKGNFVGQVAYPGGWPNQFLVSKGNIENGKPEGTWTTEFPNGHAISKEEFKGGKFVKGILEGTPKESSAYHLKNSKATTFFLNNYLGRLEDFVVDSCHDYLSRRVTAPTQFKFDYGKFQADMRSRLNKSIDKFLSGADNLEGAQTTKYLTVEFTVNKSGKAEDFKMNGFWGNELFYDIKECIQLNTSFPPDIGKMYFHLKVDYSGGNQFSYGFSLSQDANPH
ncbi:toxin-antitoxin system YwqK family antitoxin [Pinibacter soli]|uniref:MORN repeat variant n=1 Tax=Pinibacter soli TaxID=3044211 RepID=A0ABT6R6X7_9BACT|nr:hypothetical protein [Pinibacter soli]MDI3318150.1 hypothetical protein [Pinibacter soli]